MSGIENIISKIESDSENSIKSAAAKAEEQGREIADKLISEAESEAEKILLAASEKAENISRLSAGRCEKLKKQNLLAARVELINQTISDALSEIEGCTDEKYFDYLLKILKSNIQPGECTMFLGEKDMGRALGDFEEKAKALAGESGAALTLSPVASKIKNGFYLKYGDIEINCTFDALAQSKKEELFETVNNILFQAVKEN